ncbi:MAG: transporter substrate-binding domain-containing protein [Clostridia bacterium]|nr:transporter substrate-binding domain-containing protein [Clostridia bacterium]
MKKIISLIVTAFLAVSCLFGLTACGSDDDGKVVKIGAQTSTTGHIYANCLKNVEAIGYKSPALAIDDMLNGTIDYVIVDSATAETIVAEREGAIIIDIPLSYDTYAVGVDKNQDALKDSINKVLFENAEEINSIIEKYNDFETNKSSCVGFDVDAMVAKAQASASYSNPEAQLVVATNAEFGPWEFVEDGKYYGIDIEIANMIAQELNLELVIVNMDFDAVPTSVGTNNIDCAIAALSITAERKESLNFTNGYFSDTSVYQVVVCKESDTKLDGCMSAVDVISVLTGLV